MQKAKNTQEIGRSKWGEFILPDIKIYEAIKIKTIEIDHWSRRESLERGLQFYREFICVRR
jgi:hypothetical protein